MRGNVEIFWVDGATKEKTLLVKDNNTLLVGASKTVAEYLAINPDPYMASAGLYTDQRHNTASATYLAVSNCGIQAISFGKDRTAYMGTSGNAHTPFNYDGFEGSGADLYAQNVIYAIEPNTTYFNASSFGASATHTHEFSFFASGLTPHSNTYIESASTVVSTVLVSALSACLAASALAIAGADDTGFALSDVQAGVASAFEVLQRDDPGHNKNISFAPEYFLSFISGIDPQGTLPLVTPIQAYSRLWCSGEGIGNNPVSAIRAVANYIGCYPPSAIHKGLDEFDGSPSGALVLNHTHVNSTVWHDPEDANVRLTNLGPGVINTNFNMDVNGFIKYIGTTASDKTKGLIQDTTTSGFVSGTASQKPTIGSTYKVSLGVNDIIAAQLYGGIYNIGLWTIDPARSAVPSNQFDYLRNPLRYRLFSQKIFDTNLLANLPINSTVQGAKNSTLEVNWTINFHPTSEST